MTASIASPAVRQSLMNSIMGGVGSMVREKNSTRVEQVRDEIAERILLAAWPPQPGEGKLSMLERWARRCGLPSKRVKRLHYREIKVLPAHEVDDIRAITGCLKALRERQARLEAATSYRAPDQLALPLVGGSAARRGGMDL